jgi:long-chain fatty acid transport protein
MESQLGKDDGAGFGWKDILAVKFGVMYSGVNEWDFMAGYSYNENPIPDTEVLFNILAPAVIQNHITAGFTKHLGTQHEISLAFMYALVNSVTGANPLEAPNQQTIEIAMKQWQLEVGYAFSFVQ